MKTVCGLLVASLLVVGSLAQSFSDNDILTFALQLECLEAEFYNIAAGNGPLSAADRGGGPLPIGGQAAPLSSQVLGIAKMLAKNELSHVRFLRSALGSSAPACPLNNLTAFADVFNTAVAPDRFSPAFSPFTGDVPFLLATFLFEDVGASAYQGAAPLLSSKTNLAAAAGNFATESYQGGMIRYILFNRENNPYQIANGNSEALNEVTGGIAALRAKLGGGSNQNVINPDGSPEIAPVDGNGQTFPRTTSQIIAIGTGGAPNRKGGFFPNGLNGSIQ